MMIVRVPDNYDPVTRQYSGVWTGGFKWAWTDNPAWVFYDILISDRYGLGQRIDSTQVDESELYRIAQYCDQLVPDGRGADGMEPRFKCDVYIQSREDAWTVLTDFAAIFHGMTCYGQNQIVTQADMPRDLDYTYTRANVINGKFAYSSSSERTRYTTAMVGWSDPANHYADAVESVFENALVRRYGVNQTEITAIGCTRQSEANRRGRWALLSNSQDRTVEFSVGLDGLIPFPGHIIGVADQMLSGRVMHPTSSSKFSSQIATSYSTKGRVFFRCSLDGIWNAWKEVYCSGASNAKFGSGLSVENEPSGGYIVFNVVNNARPITDNGCKFAIEIPNSTERPYMLQRKNDGTTTGQIVNQLPVSSGQIAIQGTSGREYKKDVVDADGTEALNRINELRLVNYIYIDDEKGRLRFGFIAEEAEIIAPQYIKHMQEPIDEIVDPDSGEVIDRIYRDRPCVDNNPIIMDLLGAIQALTSKLNEQEARLLALEKTTSNR